MSKPRPRKKGNPDLRRRTNQPGVEVPEITKELFELLEPTMFTPLKYLQGNHEKMMRDRLLSLPVMVALVVSLVYRQIAGLSEAVRLLEEEGLLWVKPLKVTRQAVSKRIMNVPAEIFAILIKISPPQADGVWKMFCSQTDGFHCNFNFFAASSGELNPREIKGSVRKSRENSSGRKMGKS